MRAFRFRWASLTTRVQAQALALGFRSSGPDLWRTAVVVRVLLTVVIPLMVLSGWVSMRGEDVLRLAAATWAYSAFVWWVSPRAGVWLDGLNLLVDLTLLVLVLRASGGTGSPLTILAYLWVFAMCSANLRERVGLNLVLLGGAALTALALGALGSPRLGPFLGFHGLTLLLFAIVMVAYIRQLQSSRLDTLTGVLHRGAGVEKLQEWLQSNRPLRLAFVDLRGFKQVNDTYGHRGGDEVLQAVAGRIRGAFRAEDLVLRYGGDEFIVVTTAADAFERLQGVFANPFQRRSDSCGSRPMPDSSRPSRTKT